MRPLALWPLLLCKAVLKAMAAFRMLDDCLPHRSAAFTMLTGWPQEDLCDPHSGTRLHGGALFDRLEDATCMGPVVSMALATTTAVLGCGICPLPAG